MSKITKIVEIIFFFLIIPTILIPINSNIIMFATLSLVAFFCFIYLRYKKINLFDKNEFKFDQGLNQVFYKAFFIAILILLFSCLLTKKLFSPLNKSNLTTGIVLKFSLPDRFFNTVDITESNLS